MDTGIGIPRTRIVPYKKSSVSLMVDMCPSIVDLFVDVRDKVFTSEELLGEKNLK
jgi:hypothetical protein